MFYVWHNFNNAPIENEEKDMNLFKTKIATFAVVFLMLFYFTNDFSLIDIEKTAIVVALGIDFDNNEYTVTTQIATPSSQKEQGTKSNAKNIESKGKTVGEAIDKTGEITGWYPMLSFCELIVLGKNVLDFNLMDTLSYFLRSDKIPDSALLATCDDKASEILSGNSPLDDLTALALEKVLSGQNKNSDFAASTNIKDFAKGYYSISKSSFIPVISPDENVLNSKQSTENSQSKTEEMSFKADMTKIFSNGIICEELNKEETLIFNLLNNKSTKSIITVENQELSGETTEITLRIRNFSLKKSLILGSEPEYSIEMNIAFKIEDTNSSSDKSLLTPVQPIPCNILTAAKDKISSTLESLYDKCVSTDCDLLKIKENLYKYHYDDYDTYKDFPLNKFRLKLNISCNSFVKNQLSE